MALVLLDRARETTNTTGTGTYTLAGAVTGYQSFSAVGNGNITYYCATDGTNWEVGIGTYTASGTTLSRNTILESSNSGSAVSWGAGAKDIFITYPAEKAISGLDGSAKAWVNFNGTGTVAIRASFNVSSITDSGTGTYTVNFTSALADANYSACAINPQWSGGPYVIAASAYSSSSLGVVSGTTAGASVDLLIICVAVFR
jgi:hypothetical protein